MIEATLASVAGTPSTPGNNGQPIERMTPVQLGLLSGGGWLAVTTPVDPAGRPVLTKPNTEFDAVTRAVHASIGISRATRLSPTTLLKRPAVAAALDVEPRQLEAAGLLTTQPRRFAYVIATVLVTAFVGLGIARAIAGGAHHKPIGFLVALVIAAAVAFPVLIAKRSTPRLSRSGKVALRELRRTNLHLSPSLHPAWTTYGPSAARVGLARRPEIAGLSATYPASAAARSSPNRSTFTVAELRCQRCWPSCAGAR